ncbi:hypothetical protein MYCTH_2077959 [Thermothelomyces thermophilus ATCC 42464]|uniref:Septum-promoting GTP-binding protein 1 n=1 Tax=Thermothelomyces thermophilus (strain ATCC 42464 / BCRC 31852 / DSM 1799) TaxID=573729 RepID=G2Q9M3_THET4|nr:uncharacterized protein MYCTH_2077959 [Thermothelomyces thermophilus ATCC 42464]AEO56482.1 hypothetical protein MYCTH_2077959 [Thermothelomyces thermophilus ATCC 42464]
MKQEQAIAPTPAEASDLSSAPAPAPLPADGPDGHDDTLGGLESESHQAVPEHNMHEHNGYHDQPQVQSQPADPSSINSSAPTQYPADNVDGELTARYATPPVSAPAISRPPSGLSGQGTAYGADQASRAGSNGPQTEAQNPGRNHVVIKVGMVGDAQIGKTSLMVKYVEGSWDEDYIQTLGVNFMEKTISIRNTEITFSIWDLGGQREFVNMLPLVCNDAVAILFMFDLTRKSTLNSIKEWYRQGRGFNKTAIPVLVGTKYDHFVNLSREEQEEISNQARRFAKAMRASLIFSSTSHSINVQKIFKIVLSKAFDLKCTIPEITNVGEPLLIYQSC